MANAYRSSGSWRNAMLQSADGLNSPLAAGLMEKGIGSGNRESMEQQGRASQFLDDYLSTTRAVGQGYTDMAAAAGSQGMKAIASHKIFEAQKAAAEAANSAGAMSGAMGIAKGIFGLFL